jgi:DNA ligase (NAD+)
MQKVDIKAAKNLVKDLFLLATVTFEDCEIKDLVNLAMAAKDAYYNSGSPIIDDGQYDALERYIKISSPEDDVTEIIGSTVRTGEDVPLPFVMGGLTQVYEGEIDRWVSKHKMSRAQFVWSHKLDGNSIELIYTSFGEFTAAFTRGDGLEGKDVTRSVKQMNFPKKLPAGLRYDAIRAEIILVENKFDKVNAMAKRATPYKNPRNMVAGLLNASESNPAILKELSVVTYEVMTHNTDNKIEQLKQLEALGFEIPVYGVVEGKDLTDANLTKLLAAAKKNTKYEIDGLVIDVVDEKFRNAMNPTSSTLNPEYARKYKIADASNSAIAEVVAVHWGVSKTAYLKPRVEIKPVDLVGVTVTYATGFNAKFIFQNKVGPGAKIHITRSGDVIPFITEVVEPMPTKNYAEWFSKQLDKLGGWEWTDTMVDAYLTTDHPDVAIERAISFFTILDVDLMKEGNVRKLFAAGLDSIPKIINADKKSIVRACGENGNKIYDGIVAKLTNVEITTLMAATGLLGRGIGTRKLKKVWEASQGDRTIFMDMDAMVAVEGFNFKTAERVHRGYTSFSQFEQEIKGKYSIAKYVKKNTSGQMFGQVFVFTGFRDSGLEKQIIDAGGTMGSAVSSKTTYVVAKDPNENSGKLQKAREKGVMVIGVEELKDMIG